MKRLSDTELTPAIIGAAIEVHRALGPGLLEVVYEECLAREFTVRGIPFQKQLPIPVVYRDAKLECGYRPDFLVGGRVILEIKAQEFLPSVVEADYADILAAIWQPDWLVDQFPG